MKEMEVREYLDFFFPYLPRKRLYLSGKTPNRFVQSLARARHCSCTDMFQV